MIKPFSFIKELQKNGIDFYTGVPDSLLKQFLLCIDDNKEKHIIAANEGNAIGIAAGYYLATNKIPLVYMQNSGLGNAINPLLSTTDELVHSIPMLILISWRGEPNKKDEEQHKKQGAVTLELLKAAQIEYRILPNNIYEFQKKILEAKKYMLTKNKTFVFIVKKDFFENSEQGILRIEQEFELTRENALEIVLNNIDSKSKIFSTTGKTSRELFELREIMGKNHSNDFLNSGGMGHTSSIAISYAIHSKEKNVYCIDGDGAVLMHMGSLAINGNLNVKNFTHILINNGAHESVGGQKTVGFEIDFPNIAKNCGYKNVYSAKNKKEIESFLKKSLFLKEASFLEIKVKIGSRNELGRPTISAIDRKKMFMKKK
jgi:phosphonopyruvate decarboxylase